MNKANPYVPTFEIKTSKNYLNVKNGPVSITIIDHPDSRPWTECCVEICEVGAYIGTGYLVSVFSTEIHPMSDDMAVNGGLYPWDDEKIWLADWRGTNERMSYALNIAVKAMSENKHTAAYIMPSEQQKNIHAAIKESNK